MFYTVYRVINLHNGKEYIGKHQTDNLEDGYMGSGKWLKRAIQKYGIDSFKKEILHIFETEQEMNDKEAELVTEEYCERKDTYNICTGGKGGFGYINRNGLGVSENQKNKARKLTHEMRKKQKWLRENDKNWCEKVSRNISSSRKKYFAENSSWWIGRKHTEETKRKISKSNSKFTGTKNSQYGTIWITNGTENKKIKKDLDTIPEGWYKGRNI